MLESWRRALTDWRVSIGGFWSVPRLTAILPLPRWEEGLRVLLYPQGDRLALRQNYHHGGGLVFSRLNLVDPASLAVEMVEEVERTWRYLERLLPLPATRPTQLIAAPGLEEAGEALAELANLGLEVHEPADPALDAWIARRLAYRPWLRPHYRIGTPSLSWRRAAPWLVGGAALLGAGFYGLHAWEAVESMEATQIRLRQRLLRLQRDLQTTPPPPTVAGFTPSQIQAFRETRTRLDRVRVAPADLLIPLSRVLDRFPKWRLTALTWRRLQDVAEDGEASPAWDEAAPVVAVLDLSKPNVGDVRAFRREVEALSAVLTRQAPVARVAVSASTPPLDGRTPLSGKAGEAAKSEISATLRLKVWFRGADTRDEQS